MPEKVKPLNPYIAGSALDGPEGFFGREDILRLVETELSSPHQNAVVLFGQRRIGKTSILLQLRRRLAESGFVPVYLDLMDRARRPLGVLLSELASEVALELGLEPPDLARFDDEGLYFRRSFLPVVYEALGQEGAARRPVFLFDEFDVLDAAASEEVPAMAAARTFFPYLRHLMGQEKRLGFVIVVGRKTEELSKDFRAAFRAARYQRVSVLAEADARALASLAEREGTLRYTAHAESRILALTAGHPYFTQLTCFLLFTRAWAEHTRRGSIGDGGGGASNQGSLTQVQDAPQVTKADVDAIVPQVLEAGNNAFEWVWDGLPPAERIIFSAIAEGTEEGQVLDEEQIVEVLQEHGIRILIRELELAPRTLVEWEMLRRVNSGYCFFIELMRRWVARHKPLARVREELDRVDVVADQFFRLGTTFYRRGNVEAAIEQLREAVVANPNHLQARLLLGQCLREQGDLVEAIKELEWAYEYDAQAARYELVRTLLRQGERLEKEGAEDEALAAYERVLEVSPRERVAGERRAAIYVRRGDVALEAGDYDAALRAYEQAGAEEELRQAAERKRQMELEAYARRGEGAAQAEDWTTAVKVYEWLAAKAPDDARWQEALAQARRAQQLVTRYTAGLGAVEQQQWDLAQRALADVVYEQPDYREASRYLHLAVSGQDAAVLQAELEKEREEREDLAHRFNEAVSFPFRHLSNWGWVAMAALAVALLASGALLGALLTRDGGDIVPSVSILSPPTNSTVVQGTEVEVVVRVQPDRGVARLELEVDGERVYEYAPAGAAFPSDSPVSLRWTADGLGERTLSVIPFDQQGNRMEDSIATVGVVVEPSPTPTQEPTPIETPVPFGTPEPGPVPSAPIAGSLWTRPDGSTMVYVPAGTFWMGSTDQDIDAVLAECSDCERDWFTNEQPQREVYLDAFWIDRTEVTNAQYRRCVEDKACSPPSNFSSASHDRYYDNPDFDNYPAIYVDWAQANAYCTWAGKRLPTEAEWEKAARGDDGRVYPWSEGIDCNRANYRAQDGLCEGDTTEVGRYLDGTSPYGVLDMAGNAREWVADWYGERYYANSPDDRNPEGPDLGELRVVRGGSWSDTRSDVRTADRYGRGPSVAGTFVGFRCAHSGS